MERLDLSALEISSRNIFRFFVRDNEPQCVYNLINLLSVVLGIRTGALLVVSKPKLEEFKTIFDFPMIYGKKHSFHGNYIICNKDDSERVGKIDAIESMNMDPRNNTSEFDTLTGEVLGYFTPSFLKHTHPLEHACGIMIELPNSKKMLFFPQKIFGDVKPEYEETLRRMATQIKEIDHRLLPPGIQILDANEFIKQIKKGGRTKRKRKTRRTRFVS
jgi:hypothetical protein